MAKYVVSRLIFRFLGYFFIGLVLSVLYGPSTLEGAQSINLPAGQMLHLLPVSFVAPFSDLDSLPSIVTPPKNLSVIVWSDARFEVVATSSTPMNYQWLINGS